jgi:tRNA threonylcarbamoyladenosine biosynthesis protein TsaE
LKETYYTSSEKETKKIAASFAKMLGPGSVVALEGELGAGKTIFVKGLAEALGYSGEVTSPTFTLINVYNAGTDIYHMDFYRLNNLREILDIGTEEYFYGDNICLVEWAGKMGDEFPEDSYKVKITMFGEKDREIVIERP